MTTVVIIPIVVVVVIALFVYLELQERIHLALDNSAEGKSDKRLMAFMRKCTALDRSGPLRVVYDPACPHIRVTLIYALRGGIRNVCIENAADNTRVDLDYGNCRIFQMLTAVISTNISNAIDQMDTACRLARYAHTDADINKVIK